jgi:hypothetical protein
VVGHARHFGVEVLQRRKRLGLTVGEVNRNGGPTAPTVAKAEAGSLVEPRPSTLSKFDVGLRWVPGSAASTYWDGDVPIPCEEKDRRGSSLEPAAGSVALPLDRVLALMTTQQKLNDVVDAAADPIAVGDIRSVVRELNRNISTIVGAFVTDLLERNHRDGDAAITPLLQYAFGELLSEPVSPDDPDWEERLYRRWLLGTSEGIDDALKSTFQRRLRRRSPSGEGAG